MRSGHLGEKMRHAVGAPIFPRAVLGVSMAFAFVVFLWFGRGTTFSADELTWLMQSPDRTLGNAFDPHAGHLVFVSKILYKVVLETIGADYLTFRILTALTVLLASLLVFVYARRRVTELVALAPALALLFFGGDPFHVVAGNGFTVLFAVVCGLAALLFLDERSVKGDLLACAALCLGVLTYTTALPFLAGAAVAIVLRRDWLRRVWVVLVPAAIYGAWWLWSLGASANSGDQLQPERILVLPAWGFQSISAVFADLSGLSYDFSGADTAIDQVGPVLALLFVGAVVWRISRDGVPAGLWAAIGTIVALWLMSVIYSGPFRLPDASRYLFPALIVILLILVELLVAMPSRARNLAFVYGLTLVSAAAGLMMLKDAGVLQRETYATGIRAGYTALDEAGPEAVENLDTDGIVGDNPTLVLPFASISAHGGNPVADYKEFSDRYGKLGFSFEEVAGEPEPVRVSADQILVNALGIGLDPVGASALRDCEVRAPAAGGTIELDPPAGGSVLNSRGAPATVNVALNSGAGVPVGTVAPGSPVRLAIPDGLAGEAMRVSLATDGDVQVCR